MSDSSSAEVGILCSKSLMKRAAIFISSISAILLLNTMLNLNTDTEYNLYNLQQQTPQQYTETKGRQPIKTGCILIVFISTENLST